MSAREYNGEIPEECDGKNFHGAIEVLHADVNANETQIVAYCDDCDQEITAYVDLKHADSWFESE
jgi:hypothetical protein